MSGLLLGELNGGVLRLTMNDAPTRNSLSEEMIEALASSIAGSQARAIIIAANGPAFSSGHNLKEITAHRADADKGLAYFKNLFDRCAALMLAITQHPCPITAEVDGLASAAGCQLVASCDFAVATENATFCTPGVNIGLFCSTPMVAVSRVLARKHAMELLLTGDIFSAADALRMGLVNRVVGHNELKAATTELANKIASKSSAAMKIGKLAFDAQLQMPVEEAYAFMAQIMAENLLVNDAKEGIGAFLQKRHPAWDQDP